MELLNNIFSDESHLLDFLAWFMIIMAVVTLLSLQFQDAPYGRYATEGWGLFIPGKLAWVIQELPSFSVPVLLIMYERSPKMSETVNVVLIGFYIVHYIQRLIPMLHVNYL